MRSACRLLCSRCSSSLALRSQLLLLLHTLLVSLERGLLLPARLLNLLVDARVGSLLELLASVHLRLGLLAQLVRLQLVHLGSLLRVIERLLHILRIRRELDNQVLLAVELSLHRLKLRLELARVLGGRLSARLELGLHRCGIRAGLLDALQLCLQGTVLVGEALLHLVALLLSHVLLLEQRLLRLLALALLLDKCRLRIGNLLQVARLERFVLLALLLQLLLKLLTIRHTSGLDLLRDLRLDKLLLLLNRRRVLLGLQVGLLELLLKHEAHARQFFLVRGLLQLVLPLKSAALLLLSHEHLCTLLRLLFSFEDLFPLPLLKVVLHLLEPLLEVVALHLAVVECLVNKT